VYQLNAHHPFVDCELIFTCKVVQVLDQAVCELLDTGVYIGPCRCLDLCCEVRVELVCFAV
jgi:hypothetical protein